MKSRTSKLGDKNLIGHKITRLRKAQRITQKALMAKMQTLGVDMNYTSLSKLEGQTRIATDKEVLVLSQIWGVDINDLFSQEHIKT